MFGKKTEEWTYFKGICENLENIDSYNESKVVSTHGSKCANASIDKLRSKILCTQKNLSSDNFVNHFEDTNKLGNKMDTIGFARIL
jgi:RNA polymerase sigma-70 factor (ECF subfamily)